MKKLSVEDIEWRNDERDPDYVDRDHPEWEPMWRRLRDLLSAHGLSTDLEAGEGWQYMGSFGAIHTFRNRDFKTKWSDANAVGARVCARVPRSGAACGADTHGALIICRYDGQDDIGVTKTHSGDETVRSLPRARPRSIAAPVGVVT